LLTPGTLAFTTILALLVALGPLATDMYLPSLPVIAAEFAASEADVQLTLSVFLLGFAAGQIVYGPVSDRIGRKPTLVAGLVLFALASLVCAIAPSVEALIGARFLQALGASGPIVLARSVVRDVYEGDRAGRELARIGSIMGIVPTIAPTIGGFFHIWFGWPSTFLSMVLVGFVLVLVIVLRLPETLREPVAEPLSFLSILRGFREVAGNAGYRANVAIICVIYGGLFAFISGSSFVLQGFYGLAEIPYGIAFGACAFAYVSGTLIGQPLVQRYGFATTLGIGCAITAIGGLGLVAGVGLGGGHAAEIVAPMMVYMIGVGVALPQGMAGALMPFPNRAGAASSLMGFAQMVAAAALGILVGHGIGATPWPLVLVIAAMGLAAVVIFATTRSARAIGILPRGH